MYESPRRFPAAELKTERLLLRSLGEEDIEPTVAMFSDEAARRWLSAPQPYTVEDARRWCTQTAHTLHQLGDGINWTIADRETGRFIGGIGVKETNWARACTEVGYAVGGWARGHGYATEATRAVAEWVLRDLRFQRLELFAAVDNAASCRVAEKAGFVREGVARNAGITPAGLQDMVMFAMIPADLGL